MSKTWINIKDKKPTGDCMVMLANGDEYYSHGLMISTDDGTKYYPGSLPLMSEDEMEPYEIVKWMEE